MRTDICLGFLLVATSVAAQQVKKANGNLDFLAFSKDELGISVQSVDDSEYPMVVSKGVAAAFDALRAREGVAWRMNFDRMTGRPAHMEGEGIAFIPGSGNRLTGRDLGLAQPDLAGSDVPLDVVASKAKALISAYPGLFAVSPDDLVINRVASGPVLDYLYFIDFDVAWKGIPVDRAHVVFRINHGNLIQIGQDAVGDQLFSTDTVPGFPAESAWMLLRSYLLDWTGSEEILEPGKLVIVPVSTPAALSGAAVAPGAGLAYKLVWQLSFRRPGVVGTWEARIDAHDGQILSFLDTNDYGHVQGGVMTQDGRPADSIQPFPFANYSGTTNFADAAGNFAGTAGTCTMLGKYVKIVDTCGSASLAADGTGLINFGTNTGTDCSTPGTGGAGNDRAARTQYWNVTQIKLKALTYMPTNNWLSNQLTDNVNLNQTCNAYWNGSSLNFFRSGGGCQNTGEIPGISLHEWGHGMDSNDGKAPADKGTGETYGDFSAVLQTHQSCVGGGFFSNNCDGYGDACRSCRGIRRSRRCSRERSRKSRRSTSYACWTSIKAIR